MNYLYAALLLYSASCILFFGLCVHMKKNSHHMRKTTVRSMALGSLVWPILVLFAWFGD